MAWVGVRERDGEFFAVSYGPTPEGRCLVFEERWVVLHAHPLDANREPLERRIAWHLEPEIRRPA